MTRQSLHQYKTCRLMQVSCSWAVFLQPEDAGLICRQRGCQAAADRSFPIHAGGQSCRFSNLGFRWWWQLWMHPVGSCARPFFLISLSEGEFSRVSTNTYKSVAVWPPLFASFSHSKAKHYVQGGEKNDTTKIEKEEVKGRKKQNRNLLLWNATYLSPLTLFHLVLEEILGPDIRLHFQSPF